MVVWELSKKGTAKSSVLFEFIDYLLDSIYAVLHLLANKIKILLNIIFMRRINMNLINALKLINVDEDYFKYVDSISEIVDHHLVKSMNNYIQHGDITTFNHFLNVSYKSFLISKKLNLDYISCARAGLLHDFFLYDWHDHEPLDKLHGFAHPHIALKNAENNFQLNDIEKDIIVKHMWPLTLKAPKYRESYIVCFVDKYCSLSEIVTSNLNRIHNWALRKKSFVSNYFNVN